MTYLALVHVPELDAVMLLALFQDGAEESWKGRLRLDIWAGVDIISFSLCVCHPSEEWDSGHDLIQAGRCIACFAH